MARPSKRPSVVGMAVAAVRATRQTEAKAQAQAKAQRELPIREIPIKSKFDIGNSKFEFRVSELRNSKSQISKYER